MNTQQLFAKLYKSLQKAAELCYLFDGRWYDNKTVCPKAAHDGAAAIIARAETLAHDAFVSKQIGKLLDSLLANLQDLTPAQQLFVKRLKLSYDRERALPTEFVQRKSEVTSKANEAWKQARTEKDFGLFAPFLTEVIQLTRQEATYYGGKSGNARSLYQALLSGYEPGMSVNRMTEICQAVRKWLVPFVRRIQRSQEKLSHQLLYGSFPRVKQQELCTLLLQTLGYDFERGVLLETEHPFMSTVGPNDHRVTTKYREEYLPAAFFGTGHEFGHAAYEQGLDLMFDWAQVKGSIHSLGIGESQSRMWENFVLRGRPFWEYFYPKLVAIFPQFQSIPLEAFLEAINVVEPSAIRIYADEVTYNLHIFLRFELELEMMKPSFAVDDLPEAFADKMEQYVGYRPKDVSEGVLQDMHWGISLIGYFPTYLLGNLTAAQLFAAFSAERPGYEEEFRKGNFRILLDWLRLHVHPFGNVKDLDELLIEVTGKPLNPQHWFDYIEKKFGELYQL